MQRYFVDKEQFGNGYIHINGDDVHHIVKVMRTKIGEDIICSNNEGLDVVAEITAIDADQVTCKIVSKIENTREPKVNIMLAQGLPKADKMDFIIQKGTEVGVSSFLPFTSERTVVKLDNKKAQKKIERWNKIAKEAAEQSHRSKIPQIMPVLSFKELLQQMKGKLSLIAYEKEDTVSLYQVLNQNVSNKEILLIIGPEGGFSEKEVTEALDHGAISISLGKRILRTETASLVGIANTIFYLEENSE